MRTLLVVEGTHTEVKRGNTFRTFRGERMRVTGWEAPHKPSSTGRIYVEGYFTGHSHSFFPSVCGLEFIDPEHEA